MMLSKIDEIDLRSISWNRLLLGNCQLIVEGMLLSNNEGKYYLRTFIDEQRMCRLYEKFILEYYKKEHPSIKASASHINWMIDEACNTELLPTMKSDVMLEHGNHVLIIDAKYYGHSLQTFKEKQTNISSHLYQIFTYVKNHQYDLGDEYTVNGMLLYAETNVEGSFSCEYPMHGNQIFVRTLDLNQPFDKIKEQLDEHLKCLI